MEDGAASAARRLTALDRAYRAYHRLSTEPTGPGGRAEQQDLMIKYFKNTDRGILLITGNTGGGKTLFVRTVVAGLKRAGEVADVFVVNANTSGADIMRRIYDMVTTKPTSGKGGKGVEDALCECGSARCHSASSPLD